MSSKFFARVWGSFLCCTLTGLPQCCVILQWDWFCCWCPQQTHSSWIRVDSLVYTTSVPPILPFTVNEWSPICCWCFYHTNTYSTADFSAWLHDLTHWHAFISLSLSLSLSHTHTQIEPPGRLVLEKALHTFLGCRDVMHLRSNNF